MRLPNSAWRRTLQRQGKVDEARAALTRFQQLTTANLSFPFSHTYGEEGSLGRAEDAATNEPKVESMIPVTFSRAWQSSGDTRAATHNNNACLIDVYGDGRAALLLVGSGASAVRMFRNLGTGGFELLEPAQTGLQVSGDGVGCAVGDFDNDGLPDIAVAMSDRILLFRNTGGGRFANATQTAKIIPMNHPSSLTFVDFDHDGDLDLFVTGSGGNGAKPNILWRNNGEKTFTDWTQQAGLGGERSTTASLLTDLNNDRAVDLVVTGLGSAPTFLQIHATAHSTLLLYFQKRACRRPLVSLLSISIKMGGWILP